MNFNFNFKFTFIQCIGNSNFGVFLEKKTPFVLQEINTKIMFSTRRLSSLIGIAEKSFCLKETFHLYIHSNFPKIR